MLHEVREWLSFAAEWIIVAILIAEYNYDRSWNEHLKRQKRKQKAKMEFDALTTGEMK